MKPKDSWREHEAKQRIKKADEQRVMLKQAPIAMVGELGAIKEVLEAIEIHLGSIADSAHKLAHPLVVLSRRQIDRDH